MLFVFLIFTEFAYSQSFNINDINKDSATVTRNFKDSNENEIMQYYKYWLMTELNTARLNDLCYLDKVINFLENKKSEIRDIIIDTMNYYEAYNYLKDLDINYS